MPRLPVGGGKVEKSALIKCSAPVELFLVKPIAVAEDTMRTDRRVKRAHLTALRIVVLARAGTSHAESFTLQKHKRRWCSS